MYCNCSSKNNYEVIALCDIKKFTDKNGPFNNKAWVQISVADILMLDCNKLSIEKIDKIYITVSITNTKIIHTPISPNPNSEGMTLTGKKLLIDGFLCSKIVYTSLTREQTVYSSNFTVPFCTYVVIEQNADPFNDKYCVKTCIEDVFLSLIDCKTIFQNVTLFLLAEKTSFNCAVPQPPKEDCTTINDTNIIQPKPPISDPKPGTKIPNPNPVQPTTFLSNIILNDLDGNDVITITFNTSNNKIISTSTGKTTDAAGGPNYFKFTLYESNGKTQKISANIGGNKNGMDFSSKVSNTSFKNGDVVTLSYEASDKVIITNYPDENTPTYTPTASEISFKITQSKLVPYIPGSPILKTLFILKSLNDEEMAKIQFNKNTKKLVVSSTGVNYGGEDSFDPFSIQLKKGSTTKASSFISGTMNADKIKNNLNDIDFEYGDNLIILYKNKTKVFLENYPDLGDIYTMKNNDVQPFIITTEGVTPILTPNKITVKSKNNEEVLSIEFTTETKEIMVSSTGVIPDTSSTEPYFIFAIKDENGNDLFNSSLNSNETGNNFKSQLNRKTFEFEKNLIVLTYKDNSKVEISNYPTSGTTYMPDSHVNIFKILPNALIDVTPILIPNKITVKSKNNEEVLSIEFTKETEEIMVFSTGVIPDTSSIEPYFTFTLKDENGDDLFNSSLNSNETGNNFKSQLNRKTFEFGRNVIVLTYKDNSKIEISNYPTSGKTYAPNSHVSIFQILPGGLVDFSFNSKIKIINDNNEEVSTLYFIKPVGPSIVTIIATSTDAISTNSLERTEKYIQHLQYDKNSQEIYGEILGKENGENFSTTLNNTSINFNSHFNFLRIFNKIPNRIIINDYKSESQYKVGEEPEFLSLTGDAIKPSDYVFNKIRFKNNDNSTISFMYFYNLENLYYTEFYSTGIINRDSDNLSFKFLDITGTIERLKGEINKNENGDSIKFLGEKINHSLQLRIGEILELQYSNGDLVEFFNAPFSNPPITLTNTSQRFIRTSTKLIPIDSLIPNIIIINNFENQRTVGIMFNTTDKKINSFEIEDTPAESTVYDYLIIKLYNLNDSKLSAPVFQATLKSNGKGRTDFLNAIKNISFEYDQVLEITSDNRALNKIFITNFPNKGNINKITNLVVYFKITPKGLVEFTPV